MLTAQDYKNGQVLLIDKPQGWTSFDVVNKIRWQLRKQFKIAKIKVGHAGTLDPLATGLLVICTGRETKNISGYQSEKKEYEGSFTLGASTPSYDLETEIDNTYPTDHITQDLLLETAQQFTGNIQQKPPLFSAIKKQGKRLYEFARKGEVIEIASREVIVYKFELTKIDLPTVYFRVICSKGTYIRSLACDFGKAVHSGAYLSALRRTKIGDFAIEKAQSITTFIDNLKVT